MSAPCRPDDQAEAEAHAAALEMGSRGQVPPGYGFHDDIFDLLARWVVDDLRKMARRDAGEDVAPCR